MKRSMCGLAVLAAALGLVSCGGDPTDSEIEQGQHLTADPSSVFVGVGGSKFVVVELVDVLGNQLAADFQAQNVGPGVTVEKDTTYLQTTIGTHLETSARFVVTGTAPTATSFELASGNQTVTVPVKVTPTGATISLSNPTPAANEGLVITLPAGYKFGAGAGASVAGAAGIVQSVAPDSSSVTVLLPPGATGEVTVDSVQVDYIPGVLFSLPTPQTVTVGAVTPQTGTNSPASAPTLTLPAPGGPALAFFDGGTYDFSAPDGPARLYKFVVTAPVVLSTTVDWPSPEDLGLYFYAADAATAAGDPADAGGGGAHPETVDNTFAPGTYYMAVINFNAPTTNPPYYGIQITAAEPSGE
jgi:hypothetical protein